MPKKLIPWPNTEIFPPTDFTLGISMNVHYLLLLKMLLFFFLLNWALVIISSFGEEDCHALGHKLMNHAGT